ncbi:MAG: hypothetical protein F7C34_04780, partial [Desulfurococcales archaeon]|nr:hypothetical protein [Desulfurococcales archaeon]
MERKISLGKVVSVVKTGHAVVRLENPGLRVKLGAEVIDSLGRPVGRLVDLIGRVDRPYAVVRIRGITPGVGDTLFMVLRRRVRRRGKKGGARGRRRSPGARGGERRKPVSRRLSGGRGSSLARHG